MEHQHQPRIMDFRLSAEFHWVPTGYDCLGCEWTGDEPPEAQLYVPHVHKEYVDNCFACKIKTLELCTGDANGTAAMASKKWDSENEFYASAVRQGINPDGLARHEVEAAYEASEKLGVAYDTDTSPLEAHQITSKTTEVMREVVMENKILRQGE